MKCPKCDQEKSIAYITNGDAYCCWYNKIWSIERQIDLTAWSI